MSRELYFLRSSEAKIVKNMVQYAYENSEENLEKYTEFYGLNKTDLGIYALIDNEIAGAIWCRTIGKDKEIPVLSVAILPKFKKQGVGIFMMEQFLQEVGATYSQISVDITHKPKAIKFYEKFGFEMLEDSDRLIMIKKLQIKEPIRPTDHYDPRRWMD